MLSKEEIRLAAVIIICSAILLSSCIYIFIFASQRTTFFQLELTSPGGAILPPELNVTSGQNNSLLLTVQNSMGQNQQCILKTKLLILNSTGNSLNSLALGNYTFSINNADTWTKTFIYQVTNYTNSPHNYEIIFDNIVIPVSAAQYDQSLIFQFRFDLWAYNDSIGSYSYTNTWVSSPFFQPTQ